MSTVTIEQVQEAILAHWLRHGKGPDANAIAVHLQASDRHVRSLIKDTCDRGPGKLEESRIPGFRTIEGNRHYHTPVTWEPTVEYLRARLRGEREHEHEWLIAARLLPLGGVMISGSIQRDYKVIARTQKWAMKQARELALKEFPKDFHSNSTWSIQWLGRHVVNTNDVEEVFDALDRAFAGEP